MKHNFNIIAKTTKYSRVERNINQAIAALEAGISLRTLQNIEAAKPVNSLSLFQYLDYLGLLESMLSTLPNPNQLTPMEKLSSAPKRRQRARMKQDNKTKKASETAEGYNSSHFVWEDEK